MFRKSENQRQSNPFSIKACMISRSRMAYLLGVGLSGRNIRSLCRSQRHPFENSPAGNGYKHKDAFLHRPDSFRIPFLPPDRPCARSQARCTVARKRALRGGRNTAAALGFTTARWKLTRMPGARSPGG
jgi:hypothetical protein